MKKLEIIRNIIGVILILGIVAFVYVGNYFYNVALNPKISKDAVFESNKNDTVIEVDAKITKDASNWLEEKSNYIDSYVASKDGLKLHGYKIINPGSTKWAIVVHGYMAEGKKMSSTAKEFYDMGYNVIVPDLRGHGLSEGDYIGMGWKDRLDIIEWINSILSTKKDDNIVLYGVSMGAATVMMTSGEELPSNVKAIIEDCGYTSTWDEFSYQLKSMYNLPEFPVLNAASAITKIRAGYYLSDGSAIDQVAKSKVPMLFIHGDKDEFVPSYMLDQVYDAANCEKQKLVIKGAGHTEASKKDPQTYWSTVSGFINKYIK